MKIHAIKHGTRANGPGLRTTIWVQGCSLFCKGCWNPQTWSFNGGEDVDPNELAERIVRESPKGTTGLTLSGGEPISQAVSCYNFLSMIRAIRPDWTTGMFTGFTHTELIGGTYDLREWLPLDTPGTRSLLWEHQVKRYLDWAVIGRFDRDRPPAEIRSDRPDRHFVSSGNQFLDLYSNRQQYSDFRRIVEVGIQQGGVVQVTGFPMHTR